MEFKGTGEKWHAVDYDFNRGLSSHTLKVTGNKENVLHGEMICFVGSCKKNNFSQSSKANAQLISCAPEMLEMLNELMNNKSFTSHLPTSALKVQQLIKKATTI